MNGSEALEIEYEHQDEINFLIEAELDLAWKERWKRITGAVDAAEGEERELAPSYQNDVSLREQASRYGQW